MRMANAPATAVLACCALGIGAFVVWSGTTGKTAIAPPAPPAPAVAPAPPPDAPQVASVELTPLPPNAKVATPGQATRGSLKFPDGTVRAALNGATMELEVPWPAGRPYSPIVATVSNAGTDWYQHADGSFTTTIVRTEVVSGKEVQIPLCYTPEPAPKGVQFRH